MSLVQLLKLMDLILSVFLNLSLIAAFLTVLYLLVLVISYIGKAEKSGGVIAYVKAALPSSRFSNVEEDCKEVLWLLLKPQRLPRPFSCIVMIVVYYPPGKTAVYSTRHL